MANSYIILLITFILLISNITVTNSYDINLNKNNNYFFRQEQYIKQLNDKLDSSVERINILQNKIELFKENIKINEKLDSSVEKDNKINEKLDSLVGKNNKINEKLNSLVEKNNKIFYFVFAVYISLLLFAFSCWIVLVIMLCCFKWDDSDEIVNKNKCSGTN